jgi:L-fuculose-phosphate aldolase
MYSELKNQLVKYSHRSYDKEFVSMTSGNISVRTPDDKGILIKASGVCLGDASEQDYILVDWYGNYAGKKKPSIEINFHLGIYKVRPEINSVIHLHPPHCIALSIASDKFPLVTLTAKKTIGKVPMVPALEPGSGELAQHVIESFAQNQDSTAVVLKEHGIVTIGQDLTKAFYIAELLEHEAKICLLLKHLK